MQSMMQSASKDEMKQFDLKSLISMMEQHAQGHEASTDLEISFPVPRPSTALHVEEFEDTFDVSPNTSRAHSTLPPIVVVDKTVLAAEARRISFSYTEENQKQDMMMKLTETRQRQKLQRKLLEKKKNQTNSAANAML